jgi:hypothetical protein
MGGEKQRRPAPLTVLAIAAVALFALWGIGGPLFGTSTLTATNEMVDGGPYDSAGFAGTPVTNTFLDDTYTAELPGTILFKQQLGAGNVAEWDPYQAGGTPLAAVPDDALFSPLTVAYYVLPTWLAPAYERLLEFAVAIGGTFLFLRRLSVSRPAALLAGLVYASSGFMVAWVGFPQSRVAAFIPALFWTVERFATGRRIRDAALVALPVAALLLGGFPAVTATALFTAVPYALVRLIGAHRADPMRLIRPVLTLVGSVVAGFGLALFQLLPFAEFYPSWVLLNRTQSGSAHLTPAALLTSVAPWAFGSVDPNDATAFSLSPNMVEATSYVGAAAMVLVAVAVALPRAGRAMLPRGVWLFLVVAAAVWLELIFVGGLPLTIAQHTPVLRIAFSSNFVGRARSILGLLLAVLAGVGFELVLRQRQPSGGRRRWLWPGCVAVVGLTVTGLLVWAGVGDVRVGSGPAHQSVGQAESLYGTQLAAAGVLILTAVCCVLLLRYRGFRAFPGERAARWIRLGAATVLIALVTVQSAQFTAGYQPRSPRAAFYPVTDTDRFLAAGLGHQRYASSITGMVFGTNSAYRLRSVNGHAFVDTTFGALVRSIPREAKSYSTYVDFAPADIRQISSPVLDLLGTKYFVAAPTDDVMGATNWVLTNDIATLVPGRPLTVGLPTTGPLRAVAIMPNGLVPPAVAADPHTSLQVVVRDQSGRQVAEATKPTAGMTDGTLFPLPLTGESVKPGTTLTARLTLHGGAPVTIDTGTADGRASVDSITPNHDGLRLVHVGSSVIYQRLTALPRIRWASQATVVTGQRQRLAMLSTGRVPADTVVLSSPGRPTDGLPGKITIDQDGTDTVATTVDAQGAGYLVVADDDQAGWVATVDGRSAALVPADQGLVAVHVPAGHHTVVLSYGIAGAHAAGWISAGVALLLVLCSAGEWWWTRSGRRARAAPPTAD